MYIKHHIKLTVQTLISVNSTFLHTLVAQNRAPQVFHLVLGA